MRKFVFETIRKTIAATTLGAIFAVPFAANAQQNMARPAQIAAASNAKKLTEDQKILHVLNRLGFGARPNDVARVKQIGIEKYIEQQLNPQNLSDAVADSKTQNLDALKMSNAELFAKYPNQVAVLNAVAQQNGIKVQDLRAAEISGTGKAKNKNEAMVGEAMKMEAEGANPLGLSDAEKRKYQAQAIEIYRKYDLRRPNEINAELSASRILRAAYSEKQLQETMVDFWSNHFNVYIGKGATRWFLPEYDRDVIRPNALGNFRDLLTATAKSPAMLFYLDNFQSVAPKQSENTKRLMKIMENGGQLPPRARERLKNQGMTDEQIQQRVQKMQNQAKNQRGINENYARELMELHTLGVEGGYTQKDIQEVARAFTGWTIVDPRGYRSGVAKLGGEQQSKNIKRLEKLGGVPDDGESGEFYFNEKQHDDGEKVVLGSKIKAGGMNDGLAVIDILVKHPATAKFIARKLAVKFVNDNPSEELINRVAAAFQKSDGDIKMTLRAIFTDKEFFAAENYRAKIKTPFEVVVSALRILEADTDANAVVQGLLAKMGEPLYGYQAPTGYPDTAEDWVNTGTLLERMNFGLTLASNRIRGTKVDLTKFAGRDPNDKEKVMNAFFALILQGEVTPATRATLEKRLNQPIPEPQFVAVADESEQMPQMRAKQGGAKGANKAAERLLPASGNPEVVKIVGLILGSPEFQRQ